MRIAFCLFRYFPFGGVQRNFLRIAEICASRGHELHLFTLRWDGPPPAFSMKVHRVPVSAWRNHHRYEQFGHHVQREVAAGDFDLVVGFNKMSGLDLYYAGDPCFLHTAHTKRSALYRMSGRFRHFARFERAVFAREHHAHILLIAEAQKAHFQRWYETPDERFHLLPPYISRDRFELPPREQARSQLCSELDIEPAGRIMLMIGSDYRRKGVARSMRALASLPESLRETAQLIVLGNGRAWPYLLLASRLGVRGNVHLLGGRHDVPRFLAAADLLLHPAIEENTGTAIVEGLVAGLPVLATATCGYACHVEAAEAGRVIPAPFRQDEMNATLRDMLCSADLKQWRANALQYAAGNDLSSRPERAVDVMEKLADEGLRGSAAAARAVSAA